MRWDDFRRSDNIEDARGGGGGGGFHLPGGTGGLSIGTVVVLGLIGYALGIDPRLLIGGAEMIAGGGSHVERQATPRKSGTPADPMGQFVAAVLGQTEDRWKEVFAESKQQYRPPRLRLFTGSEPSACGLGQAAMGPFYCPGDQRIYLDLTFFRDLERRFRSCSGSKACEFAATYVITHEVGHHVQNLLGILQEVRRRQQTAGSKAAVNLMQVRVELQADCFAGLWANREEAWRKRQNKPAFLEPGDIDTAMRTASAIGDDTLQRNAGRQVVPDSFTHGSAEQRRRWFMTGYTQGKVSACNTFNAATRL
jgi:predicted metalloprotease